MIESNVGGLATFCLLTAVDLKQSLSGALGRVAPGQAILLAVLGLTRLVAAMVTTFTPIPGYPVACVLTITPKPIAALVMHLPLRVRTTVWVVLLQSDRVINSVLITLQITTEKLQLILVRVGTVAATTHIRLPFTILPIYAVLRAIEPTQLRASVSLGAGPTSAFWRIYAPQTVPGVVAGCLVTIIVSLGYCITIEPVGVRKTRRRRTSSNVHQPRSGCCFESGFSGGHAGKLWPVPADRWR